MVTVTNPALHLLREGMKRIDMTQQELYDDYKARGGKAKQPGTLGAWLRGERDIPSLQLALLYTCLNERLAADGQPMVELPFRYGLVETVSQPDLEVIEGKTRKPKSRSSLGVSAPTACFAQTLSDQEERAA